MEGPWANFRRSVVLRSKVYYRKLRNCRWCCLSVSTVVYFVEGSGNAVATGVVLYSEILIGWRWELILREMSTERWGVLSEQRVWIERDESDSEKSFEEARKAKRMTKRLEKEI